eukprot:m.295864 g.295864  ORF g.295864 m.295864 type:complete len:65 (+) comp16272_c2_seq14:1378-1572(+)
MLVLPGEADTGRAVHPLFAKLHAIAARRLAAVEVFLKVNYQAQILQKRVALLVNSKGSAKFVKI